MPKSKRGASRNVTRLVLTARVLPAAKARLRKYAAKLSGKRGKFVSMNQALEEMLLTLPMSKKSAA